MGESSAVEPYRTPRPPGAPPDPAGRPPRFVARASCRPRTPRSGSRTGRPTGSVLGRLHGAPSGSYGIAPRLDPARGSRLVRSRGRRGPIPTGGNPGRRLGLVTRPPGKRERRGTSSPGSGTASRTAARGARLDLDAVRSAGGGGEKFPPVGIASGAGRCGARRGARGARRGWFRGGRGAGWGRLGRGRGGRRVRVTDRIKCRGATRSACRGATRYGRRSRVGAWGRRGVRRVSRARAPLVPLRGSRLRFGDEHRCSHHSASSTPNPYSCRGSFPLGRSGRDSYGGRWPWGSR